VLIDVKNFWRSGAADRWKADGKKATWAELQQMETPAGNNDDWKMVAVGDGKRRGRRRMKRRARRFNRLLGEQREAGNVAKEKCCDAELVEKWAKRRELNYLRGETRPICVFVERWPRQKHSARWDDGRCAEKAASGWLLAILEIEIESALYLGDNTMMHCAQGGGRGVHGDFAEESHDFRERAKKFRELGALVLRIGLGI